MGPWTCEGCGRRLTREHYGTTESGRRKQKCVNCAQPVREPTMRRAPARSIEWLRERGWPGVISDVNALDRYERCLVGFFTARPCWELRDPSSELYCTEHLVDPSDREVDSEPDGQEDRGAE